MIIRVSWSIALLAGVALASCTHHPTIPYPRLTEAGPIESGFDCAALDDAILKTEAVRWVMREDGARLLAPDERAGRIAADVAATAAFCAATIWLCGGPPVGLGEEGHFMLDSADRRLLSLLKLKQSKTCPAQTTAIAQMSDLDLYAAVAKLVADESAKQPSAAVGELRAERMRLLDGLRP